MRGQLFLLLLPSQRARVQAIVKPDLGIRAILDPPSFCLSLPRSFSPWMRLSWVQGSDPGFAEDEESPNSKDMLLRALSPV